MLGRVLRNEGSIVFEGREFMEPGAHLSAQSQEDRRLRQARRLAAVATAMVVAQTAPRATATTGWTTRATAQQAAFRALDMRKQAAAAAVAAATAAASTAAAATAAAAAVAVAVAAAASAATTVAAAVIVVLKDATCQVLQQGGNDP
jgi:hypothetical protein